MAEKSTSRIASCLWILSPFPPHPTWWSPKASLAPWQIGHRAPSSKILRPSQYWRQSRNSQSWRWALEGTTFNQSPAWGRAVELARDLVRRSGTDVRRRLSDASSMQLERARYRSGTSISSMELDSGLSAASANAETELVRCREGSGTPPMILATKHLHCSSELM